MMRVARVVLLLGVWLLAWGKVTFANVVTGLAVIALLLVAFPVGRSSIDGARLHPVGIARLIAHVGRNLVVSNVLMSRQVLARRARFNTGVIAYEVHYDHDLVIALVANIIALTPGTMTVDATTDPATLRVHFLLLEDVESAHRSIARLEHHVAAALGLDDKGRVR